MIKICLRYVIALGAKLVDGLHLIACELWLFNISTSLLPSSSSLSIRHCGFDLENIGFLILRAGWLLQFYYMSFIFVGVGLGSIQFLRDYPFLVMEAWNRNYVIISSFHVQYFQFLAFIPFKQSRNTIVWSRSAYAGSCALNGSGRSCVLSCILKLCS